MQGREGHSTAPPNGSPAGRRVALDSRVRIWADASVTLGGAPWGVLRIDPAGRDFLRRLHRAGRSGLAPRPGIEQALVDLLLTRGIVHPVIPDPADAPDPAGWPAMDVVIPAFEHPEALETCLLSLRATAPACRIIVVDDASRSARVADVARAHEATVVRHDVNRGPAAARNTGLRHTDSPIVAFIDSDCAAKPGWHETLMAHFDDPRVAVVAPRIVARPGRWTLLNRYQEVRSALDMGPRPELVTRGAQLGFLPSAALAVRRSVLPADPFDEELRVGEDVDLVWRLIDAGVMVRYEPAAMVTHAMRPGPVRWAARIVDYGTSAAELDRRHPGRLTPARFSFWNAAACVLVLARQPSGRGGAAAAVGTLAVATALLADSLRRASVDPRVAPVVIAKGLLSDAEAAGHLLRREWWPAGALALAASRRSPVARAAAAAMLVPPAREWLALRPRIDPIRFLVLRLTEDAAYGTGVILSALRSRRPRVLIPQVRPPRIRPRRSN